MENKPEEKEEIKLTKEELQTLINVISQASVRVVDAPIFIQLSDKLSKMIDL